jgi:hypothetical protein
MSMGSNPCIHSVSLKRMNTVSTVYEYSEYSV